MSSNNLSINPNKVGQNNESQSQKSSIKTSKINNYKNIQKKKSLYLQVDEILKMINAEDLLGSMYKEIYKELNNKIKKSENNNIKKKYLDDNGNLDVITFSKMMVGKLEPNNMVGGKKVILKKKNKIKHLKKK